MLSSKWKIFLHILSVLSFSIFSCSAKLQTVFQKNPISLIKIFIFNVSTWNFEKWSLFWCLYNVLKNLSKNTVHLQNRPPLQNEKCDLCFSKNERKNQIAIFGSKNIFLESWEHVIYDFHVHFRWFLFWNDLKIKQKAHNFNSHV